VSKQNPFLIRARSSASGFLIYWNLRKIFSERLKLKLNKRTGLYFLFGAGVQNPG